MFSSILVPALVVAATAQDLNRTLDRVRDLNSIRDAVRSTDEPDARLGTLVDRFEAGDLSFVELRAETLAIDPSLFADGGGITETPTRTVPWVHGLDLSRLEAAGTLATSLDDTDRKLEVVRGSGNEVFVAFDESWRAGGSFTKGGETIHTLEELGGVELEVGERVWWRDTTVLEAIEPGEEIVVGGVIENRDGEVRGHDVYVVYARNPMVWDSGREAYSTVVTLGLRLAASEGAPTPPSDRSFTVVVGTLGVHARLSRPPEEPLVFTGSGDEREVLHLDCLRHGSEVALVTNLDGRETTHPAVDVHATTNTLRLVPHSSSAPAFGLGRIGLDLERRAEDDAPLTTGEEQHVSLTVDGAELESGELTFPAHEPMIRDVILRSGNPGEAVITARMGAHESEVRVRFRWPWELLIVGLGGGALGGWLRKREPKETPSEPKRSSGPNRITVGALVGLVLVLAVLCGLVVFGGKLPEAAGSTAGAFVLALLAGYLGRPVLDTLAKMTKLSAG